MTSSIRRALAARSCSAVTAPSLGGHAPVIEGMFRMQKRAVTPPASLSGMASVYLSGKEAVRKPRALRGQIVWFMPAPGAGRVASHEVLVEVHGSVAIAWFSRHGAGAWCRRRPRDWYVREVARGRKLRLV
jgi:hypothetical protein